MINVSLDKHEILYCIEGFARGSHLRQHIWEKVFREFLPKMSEEEIYHVWYYAMRDLFEIYFGWGEYPGCGAEDFFHCMAALDLRNRVVVRTKYQGKIKYIKCYRFGKMLCPIEGSFTCRIASDHIEDIFELVHDPEFFNFGNDAKPWHKDVDIYNMSVENIHKLYHKR